MSSLHFSSFRKNNNTTRKSRSKDSIKFDKLKESLHKGTESDDEDDEMSYGYTDSPKKKNYVEPMQNPDVQEHNWAQSFNKSELYDKKENDNVQINSLIEKLNNIILLLEETQDEKKGSVIEEVILYCFLGIFIIYLVDSFVKVGKYVR